MPAPEPTEAAEADCDLHRRITADLQQSGFRSPRELEVLVEHGVVTVSGRTPTFYLRQVAVECTKRAARGARVVDRIEVPEAVQTVGPARRTPRSGGPSTSPELPQQESL